MDMNEMKFSASCMQAAVDLKNKYYQETVEMRETIRDLAEALEYMIREQEREGFGDEMSDIKQARNALTKHAATIKAARGE